MTVQKKLFLSISLNVLTLLTNAKITKNLPKIDV
jgi:hypothetical protein